MHHPASWAFGALCVALVFLFYLQNRKRGHGRTAITWIVFFVVMFGTFVGVVLAVQGYARASDDIGLEKFAPLIGLAALGPVFLIGMRVVGRVLPPEAGEAKPDDGRA